MKVCSECNGTGKIVYFVEVDRDENSVTCEKKEGICRTCNGSGEKTMTNGDKIRAMDDETLSRQLLSVINEAVQAMTGNRLPDEISDVFEGQLLAKLKLPVEDE